MDPPKGDAFAPRNAFAMKIDTELEPPYFKVSETHLASTWLLHPDAPAVEPPPEIKARQKIYEEKFAPKYAKTQVKGGVN